MLGVQGKGHYSMLRNGIIKRLNMRLFGLDIRSAKKVEEERAMVVDNTIYSQVLPFGQSYLNNLSMNLSAVFRATEIISDSVAMLPIVVKQYTEDSQEEIFSHPLNYVFKDNTGLISRYSFMKLLVQSMIIKGNGFAYIERSNSGQVTGLRFLESADVVIHYNKMKQTLEYSCNFISAKRIHRKDMIHLVKNTWDGIHGVSVLAYAKRTLDTAHNTEDSANSFFKNGCNLAGIITSPKNLSQEQKNDIRNAWTQANLGSGNSGCLLGVAEGGLDYKPILISSADAQMLESRTFNIQDIARFFGISPILLGDYSGNTSYKTMEAIQQLFLLHTLQPYVTIIEDEFTKKLTSQDNLQVTLDEKYLLKTDMETQMNVYATLLEKGVLSINEVRRELGFTPVENGDAHLIAYTDVNQNTINKKDNDDSKEDKEEDKPQKETPAEDNNNN